MPPTFGIDANRFVAVIAGGSGAGTTAVEDAEDDAGMAVVALEALDLKGDDILIGIAASGTTPFVVAAVRHARQKGLWTAGIANNPATPLLEEADLGILLDNRPGGPHRLHPPEGRDCPEARPEPDLHRRDGPQRQGPSRTSWWT